MVKDHDVQYRIKETEKAFSAFLDNSQTGCFIYQDGRFKNANPKFLEIFGYGTLKELNKSFSMSDYFSEEDTAGFNSLLSDQSTEKALHVHDISIMDKKGKKKKWIEIFNNLIQFNNNPAVFGIIIDITKRKETEEQLQNHQKELEKSVDKRTAEMEDQMKRLNQSQRAMLFMIEDLNRTSEILKNTRDELILRERLAVLGQFSGSISHELRNPLSVIDSSSYFLTKTIKSGEEKILEHLMRIRKNVKVSTSIIESLLNLTRMKKPDLKKNELIEIIDQSVNEVEFPNSIRLTRKIRIGKTFVECEPLQLKIAFKNILKNGIESMGRGGELFISAADDEAGKVLVAIKDTGEGIPEDSIQKIFEPLYTKKQTGIGFGLSITQLIVESHNGEISVESELGKCTEFRIKLPALPE